MTPSGAAKTSLGADDAGDRPEVLLWIDTFNTYFEPENARSALRVLEAAGYRFASRRCRDAPPAVAARS